MGAFSLPLGWIAVVWGCFISVVLILPTMYPITNQNFNYAVRAAADGRCGACRRVVWCPSAWAAACVQAARWPAHVLPSSLPVTALPLSHTRVYCLTAHSAPLLSWPLQVVMLCGTIILSMIAWFVSARKWFKGPVSSWGGVLAPDVIGVRPMACSSSRCPVLPRQPASTRCPLTCSIPPTPAP